jgi:hypothetical protein
MGPTRQKKEVVRANVKMTYIEHKSFTRNVESFNREEIYNETRFT